MLVTIAVGLSKKRIKHKKNNTIGINITVLQQEDTSGKNIFNCGQKGPVSSFGHNSIIQYDTC